LSGFSEAFRFCIIFVPNHVYVLRFELLLNALSLANTLAHRSRPGILVLINDADWELEGEASYVLQANDNILFVSTLHGG
jgi:hypothetical protein